MSQRTGLRDIAFMRDRLLTPLEFDRAKNGYRYADDAYEMPAHWISESNVLVKALAVRLTSAIPAHHPSFASQQPYHGANRATEASDALHGQLTSAGLVRHQKRDPRFCPLTSVCWLSHR